MNKKGFTLIELVAVIIILGIIALIAIPVVNNVINESKEKAAKVSTEIYVKAIEDQIAKDKLLGKETFKSGKTYLIKRNTNLVDLEDGNVSLVDGETVLDIDTSVYLEDIIKVKGNIPEDGYITIKDGKIEYAAFVTDGMLVSGTPKEIKNGEAEATKYTGGSNISSVVINNPKEGILGGQTYQLEIVVNTKDGNDPDKETTYSSSNTSVATINKNGLITAVSEGTTEITVKAGRKKATFILKVYNQSLLGYVGTLDESGIYQITINSKKYDLNVIVLEGNQVISSNTTYGTLDDCATGTDTSQKAKRMVVVKVKGDYTVNSGVTVGPKYHTSYGGPKGFMLYVTGKLTNNGTIDNSHGAYAVGQDVYLYKNSDNTYEYVPATGATGGATVTGSSNIVAGIKGNNATGRQTGGGGSGAANNFSSKSGTGGSGTSYSGGTGGGYAVSGKTADAASSVGGAGGSGAGGGASGTGNPSGGTGGLLIIYANEYKNNGTISANGSYSNSNTGSSGGGSINIFTNQSTEINSLGTVVNTKYSSMLGNVSRAGGSAQGSGGAGGTGSINIGEIRNGQYYDLKTIIQQDIDAYNESITITGDSILSIVNSLNLNQGEYYYNFKVKTIKYPVHLYVYDGNQNWSGTQSFGALADCATGESTDKMAQSMVVVKVKGNLTNNGTIRPTYNTTYGGPKGFMLFVTGTLNNTGTIDNSHGAYATGQKVYLWKNSADSYEYVPATGATGGGTVTGSSNLVKGQAGNAGTGRQTGGGGSGCAENFSSKSGAGGTGTSYSGGAGGGNAGSSKTAEAGSSVGGAGSMNTANNTRAAGNPSGGTGGLLIIYANNYNNTGTISAKGATVDNNTGDSGGGSINIFYQTSVVKGTTNASGGAYSSSPNGGKGGNGTVTYKQISW